MMTAEERMARTARIAACGAVLGAVVVLFSLAYFTTMIVAVFLGWI